MFFPRICDILIFTEKSFSEAGDFMAYNFDFSYLKNGAPAVTLSSFGIAFNKGAIESLGTPDQVIIGYDPDQQAIGVRARGDDTTCAACEKRLDSYRRQRLYEAPLQNQQDRLPDQGEAVHCRV